MHTMATLMGALVYLLGHMNSHVPAGDTTVQECFITDVFHGYIR